MADMKGDLSGVSQTGSTNKFIDARIAEFGIGQPDSALPQLQFGPSPVRFFDVFGEQGHPMCTIISEMGPILLSSLMGLNETQSGVLNILAADKLMMAPKLYSTFLLWLLSEFYDQLPETGDMPLPKFVFSLMMHVCFSKILPKL